MYEIDITLDSLNCCGIKELDGISSYTPRYAEKIIAAVAEEIIDNGNDGAYVLFSDINKHRTGDAIEEFIIKNKLGEVTKPKSRKNPNSGNIVQPYMWKLNHKALEKWYHKNVQKEEDFNNDNEDNEF